MKLYHFSEYDFKILKPDFFGKNLYTKNDVRFSLPRFFCYDTANPQEHIFNTASFRYVIRIKDKDIYNLDDDILEIKKKFSYDIDKILFYLSKKYSGVCYTTSFLTYAIFKTCRIFKKESFIVGKPWN